MGGTARQRGKGHQLQATLGEQASELKEELLVNGSAKMNGTVDKIDRIFEKQENIFLFIPNVIGRSSTPSLLPG
jgi:hypothetical protein